MTSSNTIMSVLLLLVFLSSSFFSVNSVESDGMNLRMLHVVFRHADRSSNGYFSLNDPYKNISVYWPMGMGEVTNAGKQHAYSLGEFLRTKYDSFLGFYNSDEVYARSTDVDRTIVTADLVLAGMYPPDKQQEWNTHLEFNPVPVHTVPKLIDELSPYSICKKVDDILDDVTGPVFQSLADNLKTKHGNFLETLENCTGDPLAHPLVAVHAMKELASTLAAEVSQNYTLPECMNDLYPEPYISIEGYDYETIYQQDIIKRLRGGPYIREFTKHFQELSTHPSPMNEPTKKVYVYSGHDDVVAPILAALDVSSQHPPFMATIIVELLQRNDSNDFFVRVLYKNSTSEPPVEIPLPGCDDVTPCPVDVFYKSVQSVIPVNWHRECGNTKSRYEEITGEIAEADTSPNWVIALGVISVTFFIVIVVLGVLLHMSTNKRNSYSRF